MGSKQGLDTLVVHAVNDDNSLSAIHSRWLSESDKLSTGSTFARMKLKGIDGARTSGGTCGLIR